MQNLSKLYASKIRQDKLEREKKKRQRAAMHESQRNSLNGADDAAAPPSAASAQEPLGPPPLPTSLRSNEFLHQFLRLNSQIGDLLPAEVVLDWQVHAETYERFLCWSIRQEKLRAQSNHHASTATATATAAASVEDVHSHKLADFLSDAGNETETDDEEKERIDPESNEEDEETPDEEDDEEQQKEKERASAVQVQNQSRRSSAAEIREWRQREQLQQDADQTADDYVNTFS